ncbi:MAG: FRG domain-containing protein [Candidatus Poribacteria bacterium]|nr:FRG domain-containing protein [Candidatus Poribacteria bacterium]
MNDGGGLDAVRQIIQAIDRESDDGNYIFRGEPKAFEHPVSSSLYRRYADDIESEFFDIGRVQEEILEWARTYDNEIESDFELLTWLQHYGGRTNLIDFTIDYLIALFFACDGFPNEDGMIYILNREGELKERIESPRFPRNRVIAQKSIFVLAPNGIIEPSLYSSVTIPSDEKQRLLDRLRKRHGISSETIYNDLHGYIRNQDAHESVYAGFYRSLTSENKGDGNGNGN